MSTIEYDNIYLFRDNLCSNWQSLFTFPANQLVYLIPTISTAHLVFGLQPRVPFSSTWFWQGQKSFFSVVIAKNVNYSIWWDNLCFNWQSTFQLINQSTSAPPTLSSLPVQTHRSHDLLSPNSAGLPNGRWWQVLSRFVTVCYDFAIYIVWLVRLDTCHGF